MSLLATGFVFSLEAAADAAMVGDLAAPVAAVRSIAAGSLPALSGGIVPAEDGLDNQKLISQHLRRAGAEVDLAENGRIALEMIRRAMSGGRPHDILVSDMQMPEMDGHALAITARR